MTPGFVAFLGDEGSRAEGLLAHLRTSGMQLAINRPGVVVVVGPSPSILQLDTGVILIGDVRSDVRDEHHDGSPAHRMPGRVLAEDVTRTLWGSYLAIVPAADGFFAMVDPSGAMPCHLVRADGHCIVSDAVTPTMMHRAGIAVRIDRSVVAGCLMHPASTMSAPLLDRVRPMIPGRLYDAASGREVATVWSPARPIVRQAECANVLRAAVDHALDRTAGPRPLVQLSGGLDSSVVFGSLAALGRRPSGFVFSTDDGDVGEVEHARAVAAAAGGVLIEQATRKGPDYRYFAEVEPSATPFLYGLDPVFEEAAADAMKTAGASGMLTGQGGDGVFLRSFSPVIAIDRRRDLGLAGLAPTKLIDDALRTGTTIWHHLLPALRNGWRERRRGPDLLAPALLGRRHRDGVPLIPHPWNVDAAGLPPGKRAHVALLANCQLFHAPRPASAIRPIHPLLSQPVLEAALGLPSWQLADGPIERALARRAFADRIPDSVRARRIKGEASARYSRAAVANLPFLRSFLLDGSLTANGLIDADALSALLDGERLFHDLDYRALVVQLSFESWFRAWDP